MKKLFIVSIIAALASSAFALPKTFSTQFVKSPSATAGFKAPGRAADDTDADENTLLFGYCDDFAGGLGIAQIGVTLGAAIQIPAQTAQKWAGSQLTKVRIAIGSTSNRSLTIYVTKDLDKTPVYTQTVTAKKVNDWNEFELTTPYDIDGSEFFVGYKTTTRATTDTPIGIDGIPSDLFLGDFISVNNQWEQIGDIYGNMCIRLLISGDNLPKNDVALNSIVLPDYVKPNNEFSVSANVINNGTKAITSMTANVVIDGVWYENLPVTLPQGGIGSGERGTAVINNLSCSHEGSSLPFYLKITTVNGVPDENEIDNETSAYLMCLSSGYPRNVVVEEWTGTWCGWCPRGIVGMTYMNENYGDKGFIGIAVHWDDAMQTNSYSEFVYKYVDGFPGCIMDRNISFDPNAAYLEQYYNIHRQIPAITQISLSANYSAVNPTIINVESNVEFLLDAIDSPYRIAYVITEDNVGPYSQTNYFAGGKEGEMGGWEKSPAKVSTYFNEVARNIVTAMGIEGSIPVDIEKGKVYSHKYDISTSFIRNINNCHVVAMVLNKLTGRVENAVKTGITVTDGIADAVADGSVAVTPVAGGFDIAGDYADCTVYCVDGTVVSNVAGVSHVDLAPGLYIVKVIGADNALITRKLSVK